ncbi:MAG: hypothetical protein KGZ51_05680 [Erysipelothrix sp.]|jgi:hypothetical protein|nr:hypothetical protein [Erysipelothrix sp.]
MQSKTLIIIIGLILVIFSISQHKNQWYVTTQSPQGAPIVDNVFSSGASANMVLDHLFQRHGQFPNLHILHMQEIKLGATTVYITHFQLNGDYVYDSFNDTTTLTTRTAMLIDGSLPKNSFGIIGMNVDASRFSCNYRLKDYGLTASYESSNQESFSKPFNQSFKGEGNLISMTFLTDILIQQGFDDFESVGVKEVYAYQTVTCEGMNNISSLTTFYDHVPYSLFMLTKKRVMTHISTIQTYH